MTFSDMLNIGLMQGFAGLSLFSVLLLMGLGLAIIFGQMGVINMAHGEFMTIGAYTIFFFSHLAESFAPKLVQLYFPFAIAAAAASKQFLDIEKQTVRFQKVFNENLGTPLVEATTRVKNLAGEIKL